MQWKVLDRSFRTAAIMKLLSKSSFHASTILISTCWVLYDFLYAAKKSEKNSSIWEIKRFLVNVSQIFEKMFKILTGRKFEIQSWSSVFLSRGFTQATFALLGKILCLKLLFLAIDTGILKGSAAILIKAGEILSLTDSFAWVQFQEILLKFVTVYWRKARVIISIFFYCNSTPNFQNARMVFIGMIYNINFLFVVIKAMFFGFGIRFFTTLFFNNMNVMFVEDFG